MNYSEALTASVLVANTLEVLAGEFLTRARFVLSVAELSFVGAVAAVVVVVAGPSFVDATAVLALELIVRAGLWSRTVVQGGVLIGAVNTVGIAVAEPFLGNAL